MTGKAIDLMSWSVWIPVIVTLIGGTVSSLSNKIMYDTPVRGSPPCGTAKFQKAYFTTLGMFMGELLCLGIYGVKLWKQKRERRNAGEVNSGSYAVIQEDGTRHTRVSEDLSASTNGLIDNASAGGKKPPIWTYAVLCLFDVCATSIGGIGLVWVDASTNQMLRGSQIVFCAIAAKFMLRRRLSNSQWWSILLVCFGLVLVGLSGMLRQKYDPSKDDDSSSVTVLQLFLGISLVILSSALNAVQNVYEEKLLKVVGAAEVDPLELLGWEGFFGSLISAFILLPIVYYIPGSDCGRQEDSIMTMYQLKNSGMILSLMLAYIVALCLMNWTSQMITQTLSAVHRNLIGALRVVLVWCGDIILFYSTQDDHIVYGENWTNYSLIELLGFIILVLGTVLYSYYGNKNLEGGGEGGESGEEHQPGKVLLSDDYLPQSPSYTSSHQVASPDYAIPFEPQLKEHSQQVKQNYKAAHSSNGNGNGYH